MARQFWNRKSHGQIPFQPTNQQCNNKTVKEFWKYNHQYYLHWIKICKCIRRKTVVMIQTSVVIFLTLAMNTDQLNLVCLSVMCLQHWHWKLLGKKWEPKWILLESGCIAAAPLAPSPVPVIAGTGSGARRQGRWLHFQKYPFWSALLTHWLLTKALWVEFTTNRTDASLPRLTLLQSAIKFLL